MKCLVTGGAGFIGSHLVDLLVDRNHTVTIVDNMSTGKIKNVEQQKPYSNPACALYIADFASEHVLAMIRESKFDVVFHLAATASVPYSVDQPVATNDNNVSKTLALLDACRIGKVKKFVFSSSSAVYGNSTEFPTTESAAKQPISPYALQKSVIEEYCKLYQQLYGLKSVCLRYFNVFGPRQAGSGAYANVISGWCVNGIASGRIRLDGNGEAFRDFVHVKDVAYANLLAASSDVKFGCYNVGSGESIKIAAIFDWFSNICMKNVEVTHAPTRPGDPAKTQASIEQTRSVFGFVPTKLDSARLVETFTWYLENR